MLYIWESIVRVLAVCTALTVTFVTVFALEKFAFLLDLALRFQVSLSHFLLLNLGMLPDISDFILPIAIVIAVYLVFLRKREARELLVFSSAGIGHRFITGSVMGIGLLSAAICLCLSGFVKPAASYLFHVQYAQAVHGALSRGLPTGMFYRQDDIVMHVAPDNDRVSKRMRVFSFSDQRLERIVLSDCADLRAVEGHVLSQLCGARVYLLSSEPQLTSSRTRSGSQENDCRICGRDELDIVRVEAADSTFAFDIDTLARMQPARRTKDLNLFELLALGDNGFASPANAQIAMEYVLRALTCMLAAAIGLGAVAATTVRTRAFAVAGGILAVVAVLGLASSGIVVPGPFAGPTLFAAFVLLGLLLCLGSLYATAVLCRERLVTPMFVRS